LWVIADNKLFVESSTALGIGGSSLGAGGVGRGPKFVFPSFTNAIELVTLVLPKHGRVVAVVLRIGTVVVIELHEVLSVDLEATEPSVFSVVFVQPSAASLATVITNDDVGSKPEEA